MYQYLIRSARVRYGYGCVINFAKFISGYTTVFYKRQWSLRCRIRAKSKLADLRRRRYKRFVFQWYFTNYWILTYSVIRFTGRLVRFCSIIIKRRSLPIAEIIKNKKQKSEYIFIFKLKISKYQDFQILISFWKVPFPQDSRMITGGLSLIKLQQESAIICLSHLPW